MRLFFFALCTILYLTPGHAAQSCPQGLMIRSIAESILSQREALGKLSQKNFGSDAAYLKLYHDNQLEIVDKFNFLENLKSTAHPPRHINELIDAFTLSQSRVLSDWNTRDQEPLNYFNNLSPSARHALLLHDSGDSYFSLYIQAINDKSTHSLLSNEGTLPAAVLLKDQSEAFRLALAQKAEKLGIIVIANALYADLLDQTYFTQFLIRQQDNHDFVQSNPLLEARIAGLGFGAQDGDIPDWSGLPSIYKQPNSNYDLELKVSTLRQPLQFLSTYLNFSGDELGSHLVAKLILLGYQRGYLDQHSTDEQAWVFAYTALRRVATPAVLAQFNWPGRRLRHYSGTAIDTLDWSLAKYTLTPYLKGEVQVLPKKSANLSADFDWPNWASLAKQIKHDTLAPDALAENDLKIVIELLWSRESYRQSLSIAQAHLPIEPKLVVIRDLMKRLHRQCVPRIAGAYYRLGGSMLYRF